MFPGVIDWFGTVGGLVEIKTSLLASHGFAALSLAYMKYEGLPKTPTEVKIEYFEEATEWLLCQDHILNGGVAVMSVSAGCEYALMLGIRRPDLIKGVVLVSSISMLLVQVQMNTQKSQIGSTESSTPIAGAGKQVVAQNFPKQGKDDLICHRATFIELLKELGEDSDLLIPVEKLECPVLFIYAEEDPNSASDVMVEKMCTRMRKHHRGHLCASLGYPGAGHLIEPPYTPHCSASFMKLGLSPEIGFLAWGGEPVGHAYAQEDSWLKILEFLRKNLMRRTTSHL